MPPAHDCTSMLTSEHFRHGMAEHNGLRRRLTLDQEYNSALWHKGCPGKMISSCVTTGSVIVNRKRRDALCQYFIENLCWSRQTIPMHRCRRFVLRNLSLGQILMSQSSTWHRITSWSCTRSRGLRVRCPDDVCEGCRERALRLFVLSWATGTY